MSRRKNKSSGSDMLRCCCDQQPPLAAVFTQMSRLQGARLLTCFVCRSAKFERECLADGFCIPFPELSMASIRKKKNSKFTPLSNGLLQDRKLTFETRGMLGYVLSKPEGWETKPSDIEREGNIGKDARRRIMKEAEIAGYLTFHSERNSKGQIICWYDAHEEPVSEDERTKSWEMNKSKMKPDTGTPQSDEGEPPTENPQSVEGEPPTENPQSVEGQPDAGFPPAGEPDSGLTASGKPAAHVENKEVQKTDLEKKEGEDSAAPPPCKTIVSVLGEAYKTIISGQASQTKLEQQIFQMNGATVEQVERWLASRTRLSSINFIAQDFKTWLASETRTSPPPASPRSFACTTCNGSTRLPIVINGKLTGFNSCGDCNGTGQARIAA